MFHKDNLGSKNTRMCWIRKGKIIYFVANTAGSSLGEAPLEQKHIWSEKGRVSISAHYPSYGESKSSGSNKSNQNN